MQGWNRLGMAVALALAIASLAGAQQPSQNPSPEPAPEAGRPRVGGFPMGPPGKILEL